MFAELWLNILATTIFEWFAVVTGVIYVILAARKNIWCWVFALFSSILYVYLCFSAQLYLESFLQLFYVIMAIVGWFTWYHSQEDEGFIIKWPIKYHAINIVASAVVALMLGGYFAWYTDQQNPFTDAFTTVFSLAATFMVTRRVLNNWWYWVVIDLVSIFLYSGRGLYLSSLLFLIFTIIAVFGWISWRKQFNSQTA
ncbi:nicotinamide riboside transporter PnuC [Paracrocinitomix mangrovi]|uniref:nicotinamide riboside transporter PnuC n=1 Tax=Paracrocinitomix mangrovi TaxID=2862509 RepID=UPI001C8D9A01|nr:nicotinamide riboside transporter PnuC [Paracrocinitomix mangrovi]UKN03578.1 nicotinamide riboside transporter PnuC [Paracrocinitomix mangrovi]